MARDQKREAIIEAAQKRFNHFGVSKTTMNEIADDLSISKASLYYYFPDKLNVYAAVLKKIIEAEEVLKKEIIKETDPGEALFHYLDDRTEFIIQHYNILEYLKTIGTNVPVELEPIFNSARSREKTRITNIISMGVDEHKITADDPKHIAHLLHDCLEGLRISLLTNKTNFFPDKKQFYQLVNREKEVVTIFIKGLSV
jgi:TetR/AcrR family transcriptional repressor of mexJK operon